MPTYTENTIVKKLDVDTENKTISVLLENQVIKDGQVIAKTNNRRAFVPGQMAELKEYTKLSDVSAEVVYLKKIWTQEVIDSYSQQIAEQENV